MFGMLQTKVYMLATSFYMAAGTGDAKSNFLGGISKNATTNAGVAVQDSINVLVKTLIGLGGLWVVACLVFAGIKLSGAQGKNPENRTAAMMGLASAAAGGYIMIKSYDIAAWVASL